MSKRFELNKQDVQKWFHNASLFLAPAVLVFLISLQSGNSLENSFLLLKLWALNTSIDLIRKYIANGNQD